MEVVAKPPPPKLSSVRPAKKDPVRPLSKVRLTNEELEGIAKLMADKEKMKEKEEEEAFFNYGKMGG